MKEFLTGMALYGLADLVSNNPTACQSLFVNGSFKEQLAPDANYLFSLMNPQYSPEGSSRRQIEENIMDHFQDCLILFEDDNVKGHSAAVAWNYKDENEFLVSKETVVLRRWERSKQKFGFIKRVDKG